MEHDGSSCTTCRNTLRASGNQKECSSATPRSKAGCTLASQEVGKFTLPSCSGGRPDGGGVSSWAIAGEAATAARNALIIAAFMSGLRGRKPYCAAPAPGSPEGTAKVGL